MKKEQPWLESQNLSLRLPSDLYMTVMLRSSDLGISLQQYVIELLKEDTRGPLKHRRSYGKKKAVG